jgi:hypothetical protein
MLHNYIKKKINYTFSLFGQHIIMPDFLTNFTLRITAS